MRTIRTKVYKFNELSENIQSKVVDKLIGINVEEDWWNQVYEDASQAGLEIKSFDIDYFQIELAFISSSEECIRLILANHGEATQTHKTAQLYKDAYAATAAKYADSENLEDEMYEIETKFLKAIGEDYIRMLSDEYSYPASNEAVIETIQANEYEFTQDGKQI